MKTQIIVDERSRDKGKRIEISDDQCNPGFIDLSVFKGQAQSEATCCVPLLELKRAVNAF